jgi:hypothetical protein
MMLRRSTLSDANARRPESIFEAAKGYRGDIPETLGDRVPFQAIEAELPAKILLWGERQCHQDTDLGNSDSKPPAYGRAETYKKNMELL